MAEFYTVEEAIEFLATKEHHLSISDLMSLVRCERLNPSFYYKGLLNEFSYSRPPYESSRAGYAFVGERQLAFDGYIKPFDDSIIPKLVSTNKYAIIRSVKIFSKISIKSIDMPLENYDSSFYEDPYEKISKSIIEETYFTVYEVSHQCNYMFKNGEIVLNTSDFIFREQELIALLPHTLLHPEQIKAQVKKHVRESSQAKSDKRHVLNHAAKAKAIDLWLTDRQRTYVAFADKYYRVLGVTHDTVKRWIGEYEKDQLAQRKKSD